MPKNCSSCHWLKLVTADWGTEYATCSNPALDGWPVVFCAVERQFDTGCGKEGKHYRKPGDQEQRVILKGSWVMRVKKVGDGVKPG